MLRRVVLTGVGVISAGVVGGTPALEAYLAAPRPGVERDGDGWARASVDDGALAALIDGDEGRRLSRASQLAVGAARLALADAGLQGGGDLAVVVGTEHGDLRSTLAFVDGYLRGGPGGLSPLLFPNTVMNAMAAAVTIAVGARGAALTVNAPIVAGQLAVARAAATVAAGRAEVALAGGVDDLAPAVLRILAELGDLDIRGEGATFLVLEEAEAAWRRGARVLGEVRGSACRGLRARPHGVGRQAEPRAVRAALAAAGCKPSQLRWVLTSASGDAARDEWERRLLDAALAASRPPTVSLAFLLGQHAGLGALSVAAAAWTARSGRLVPVPAAAAAGGGPGPVVTVKPGPGLVHGVARGGTHVALVVGGPAAP